MMTGVMRGLGLALTTLACAFSQADDAVWNIATGASSDWNVATNWLPSTTFPNGAGQVAAITNDSVVVQTIRLRQNITVGTLHIGDGVVASNLYNTTVGNNGGETYALTFDSGAAGVPARIALSKTGTATSFLSVPMVLASDLLVDLTGLDATNRQSLTLNGAMTMNGHTVSFTNGIYTQGQVTFGNGSEFTGAGEILNNSRSTLGVDGKKSFSGRLVANGKATGSNTSTFNFTNGGFTNAMEVVVNGCVSNSNSREGGGLNSGNGSNFDNNPGQRFTRQRITMNAGYLVANGQAAKVGTANDWQRGLEWVRDEVSVLDLKSGFNYIAVNKGANTTGTVFAVGTLLRARGASVYLFGPTGTNLLLLAADATNELKGANGPAGSTTLSIVPWVGVYSGGGFVNPAGFGTYEAGKGFRALDVNTEYTNNLAAGTNHNVSAGSVAIAADAAVNALRYTGGSSNIGAGRRLAITSGGLFFNGSGTLGASGSAAAGTVDFGAAEGVISVHAANASTIGARISGSGGVSKIQSGTLTLTCTNAYSGDTHVGGGVLRVGDGTTAGTLGSGNVEVHASATLRISSANAVADAATVRLHSTGPDFYFGRM
jgi:autotransporter-associated beta strand protein